MMRQAIAKPKMTKNHVGVNIPTSSAPDPSLMPRTASVTPKAVPIIVKIIPHNR